MGYESNHDGKRLSCILPWQAEHETPLLYATIIFCLTYNSNCTTAPLQDRSKRSPRNRFLATFVCLLLLLIQSSTEPTQQTACFSSFYPFLHLLSIPRSTACTTMLRTVRHAVNEEQERREMPEPEAHERPRRNEILLSSLVQNFINNFLILRRKITYNYFFFSILHYRQIRQALNGISRTQVSLHRFKEVVQWQRMIVATIIILIMLWNWRTLIQSVGWPCLHCGTCTIAITWCRGGGWQRKRKGSAHAA